MNYLGYPLEIKRKAFRRSLTLQVHLNGTIQVRAGVTVSEKAILKFLESNRQWIEEVQEEHSQQREQHPPKKFIEGEKFEYLGYEVPLEFRRGKKLKFEFFPEKLLLTVSDEEVWKSLKSKMVSEELNQVLKVSLLKCYEKAGRKWLETRVQFWSHKMQLYPTKLSIRSQKTRWGSCSSEGSVSLNWRLVSVPLPVMDYVVIHELAHLKHQNHSKNFWNLVEVYDSKYKYHRKWLREFQWSTDFLSKKSELHRSY